LLVPYMQNFSIILDGLAGTTNNTSPIAWPTTDESPSDTMDITFGSWGDRAPGLGNDSDNLNGGLRDWTVTTGIPTSGELETYRNGGDPTQIWGASRVVGHWRFTTDPTLGEPDASGNGHTLTYSDAGTAPGHSLPILVTAAVGS
jgi:hypothetical protein